MVRQWRRYWVRHPERDPALDHRSQVFDILMGKMGHGRLGSVGIAISDAGLSFLGGAPRNPNLRPGAGREYSSVRYAEAVYPYTQVSVRQFYCGRCGRYTLEKHTMELRHPDQPVVKIGSIKACSRCDAESWVFKSQMRSARERRTMLARYVP